MSCHFSARQRKSRSNLRLFSGLNFVGPHAATASMSVGSSFAAAVLDKYAVRFSVGCSSRSAAMVGTIRMAPLFVGALLIWKSLRILRASSELLSVYGPARRINGTAMSN